MRIGVQVALWAVAACSVLPAQEVERTSRVLCYHARPSPTCHEFLLTNAGWYYNVTGLANDNRHWRAMVDWGLMWNTSPRDAVGASFFVSFDENEFTAGPMLRYRRWLGAKGSLDLAIGTPTTTGNLKAGSVLGVIKYSPEHWVGFAVRPEYVRRDVFSCPGTCTQRTVGTGQVYTGLELGWWPGFTLSIGGGVVVGLLILAFARSS